MCSESGQLVLLWHSCDRSAEQRGVVYHLTSRQTGLIPVYYCKHSGYWSSLAILPHWGCTSIETVTRFPQGCNKDVRLLYMCDGQAAFWLAGSKLFFIYCNKLRKWNRFFFEQVQIEAHGGKEALALPHDTSCFGSKVLASWVAI